MDDLMDLSQLEKKEKKKKDEEPAKEDEITFSEGNNCLTCRK